MSSSAVGSLDDHRNVPNSLTVYCGAEENIVSIPYNIWKKVPYFTGMMSSGMLESVSHVIHKPDTDTSAMHLFVKLMKVIIISQVY